MCQRKKYLVFFRIVSSKQHLSVLRGLHIYIPDGINDRDSENIRLPETLGISRIVSEQQGREEGKIGNMGSVCSAHEFGIQKGVEGEYFRLLSGIVHQKDPPSFRLHGNIAQMKFVLFQTGLHIAHKYPCPESDNIYLAFFLQNKGLLAFRSVVDAVDRGEPVEIERVCSSFRARESRFLKGLFIRVPAIEFFSFAEINVDGTVFLIRSFFGKREENKNPGSEEDNEGKDEFFHRNMTGYLDESFALLRMIGCYLAITSKGSDFLVLCIFVSTVSISAVWTPIGKSFSSLIATLCSISFGRTLASFPSI